MAGKKDLMERMGDMLMHLSEKYELENEDPWLYREIMVLLDEVAKDDLLPPHEEWGDYTEN